MRLALRGAALAAAVLVPIAAARAADKPAIGPAPAWVSPPPAPRESPSARSLPVATTLNDMQVSLDTGGWTEFHELQVKVQTPEGLQALGAIPFAWSPWSDTLTFHRAAILRGDQRIDVLPKDGAFTVLRRESQLEQATLTGVLTTVLQPEGLQVGDTLEIALSIRHADPLLKGRAGALLAGWDTAPVGRVRIRARWPAALPVAFRQTADLPPLKRTTADGAVVMSLQADDVAAAIPPAHAPVRFQHGRQVEFSTFRDWGDVAALMAPLFAQAAVLQPASPLRAEVARIAAASADPKVRAAAALQLAQAKVRYLAHAEAAGGYTPQSADETWRLRYGDCKAKTALLLALLHALDVPAQAVLANMEGGDAVHDHLPSAGMFDHVLVRVQLNGRDYWLDGARQGDGALDQLPVPAYGWVLPVAPAGARLFHISPPPATEPLVRRVIRYDASKGVKEPAATRLEDVFGGDAGLALHLQLANLTPDRLQEAMRKYWSQQQTDFTPSHMTTDWNADRRELRFAADGSSKLDWSGDGLELASVELGGKPDLKRDPASSDPDAPYLLDYPSFVETEESVVMPPGAAVPAAALRATAVDKTLANVAYRRSATLEGGVLRVTASQRALAPEVAARQARADAPALKALGDEGIYAPAGRWRAAADDAAVLAKAPVTAEDHVRRGSALLNGSHFKEAEGEYDTAVDLDPKLPDAWAGRAVARAWQGDGRAAADADMADHLGKPEIAAARARAILAAQAGDPAKARAAYERALAINPKDAFSLYQHAELALSAGDHAAAARDMDQLERADPATKPADDLFRAAIQQQMHHREAALALAARVNADTAELRVARAQLYLMLDAKEAALADLDAALKMKPSAATYLLRAQVSGKDTPGAKADIAAAEALDPSDLDVQLGRVNALTTARDWPAALAELNKVIKAHPEIGNLRVGRAQVEMRLGRSADALADFAAARAGKGAQAAKASMLCHGEAAVQADPAAMLTDCSRAVTESPREPGFLIDRAVAAHRLGLDAQATADIATARTLAASSSAALNNACYSMAVFDYDLPQALAFCDAALKLEPDAASILDSRAFALLRLGRDAEAITAYDAALQRDPKLAGSLFGRAIAEKRLGRSALAAKDRAAALALSPPVAKSFSEMGLAFPD